MSDHFRPEEYFQPKTLEEAISYLSKHPKEAKVIAGGTDLLVNKPPETRYLVDITRTQINYIEENHGGIRIGATTNFSSIEKSELLQDGPYRVLAEAAHEVGHINVRHLATIGGNICNAVPSADAPIPLIALDAGAVIAGPAGERIVPLEDFFTFVRETVLKEGELLREIRIPRQPAHTGASFKKIGRTKVDIALVNVAVRVTLKDDVCGDVRIVLGAVAPTPMRAVKAEALLRDKKPDEALLEEAGEIASQEIKPISDVRCSAEYRREASKVLVKRALKEALERAEEA